MFYAEIDEAGKCFHVTECELLLSDNVVVTDDIKVLGKIWDGNQWLEPPEPEPEPETPQPTQLDKIQTAQLTIMAAMADQYEESLEKDLRNVDVQATIYEAILELGGAE